MGDSALLPRLIICYPNHKMNSPPLPLTRLAILRTMGALHNDPLRYDLETLRSIILYLSPDMVCADITQEAWEHGNLSEAPLEVREAVAPAIALVDAVLIPIAPTLVQFSDFHAPPGMRTWLSHRFDRLLQWGQRKANSPEALHGIAFEVFCHTVCALEEMTWQRGAREAYQQRSATLAENILAAIQRDPGGRVLVVIQCQWQHTLEPLLKEKARDGLQIVDYRAL